MKFLKESSLVISYLTIRKAIGILGILIPFLMGLGALIGGIRGILPSISNYYYTNMQDMFVGILCAVALFLISYKGYPSENQRINWDHITTNIAGLGALGVAFFPMALHDYNPDPAVPPVFVGIFVINEQISKIIHFASAATFFITIAFISLFLFTKTGGKKITEGKINRNRVYVICGIAILVFLALIALHNLLPLNPALEKLNPVFFLESFALIAFGFSWLVKGETLLNDKKPG